jgi:hypothetical protein
VVHVTRSSDAMSMATTAFILTDPIINALVAEINSANCLYCTAGAICTHPRNNLCFAQDITIAFKTITETAEATQANKAKKAADEVNRLRTRRLRQEEATRIAKATKSAEGAKKLLARAVLEEANDWITKVINHKS